MNHQKGEWLLITLPGLLNITLYGCHLYGYVVQGIRKKSKLVWQVFFIPMGFLRWLLLFRHPIIVYLYFKSTVSNQSSLGHFFVLIVSSSYIVINSLNFVRDPSRTCLFFYIVHFFANHFDSLVFDIVYKYYYLFWTWKIDSVLGLMWILLHWFMTISFQFHDLVSDVSY